MCRLLLLRSIGGPAFDFFSVVESRDEPFIPTARLSDLGGIDHCVEEIMELIAMPLAHPEIYIHTGVQPPRGVLLHGPPGCGKTKLAHAIAGVGVIQHLKKGRKDTDPFFKRNWEYHL